MLRKIFTCSLFACATSLSHAGMYGAYLKTQSDFEGTESVCEADRLLAETFSMSLDCDSESRGHSLGLGFDLPGPFRIAIGHDDFGSAYSNTDPTQDEGHHFRSSIKADHASLQLVLPFTRDGKFLFSTGKTRWEREERIQIMSGTNTREFSDTSTFYGIGLQYNVLYFSYDRFDNVDVGGRDVNRLGLGVVFEFGGEKRGRH